MGKPFKIENNEANIHQIIQFRQIIDGVEKVEKSNLTQIQKDWYDIPFERYLIRLHAANDCLVSYIKGNFEHITPEQLLLSLAYDSKTNFYKKDVQQAVSEAISELEIRRKRFVKQVSR
ncbi:MAG: hypothetical protein WC069_00770 [Candidatus Shapirobacteria bacterium]